MKLQGILVPIITPFGADNQVNVSALKQLVNSFVDQGVAGIVACGTTGEYYALDDAERELVLKTVAEAVNGRVTPIAGIHALSTPGAIQTAHHAPALRYEGLMLAPQLYRQH